MSERHVCLHCGCVHFCHEGDFTEVTLTLAALILQDVALALFTAKHLTGGSNFEPFADGFSRFC